MSVAYSSSNVDEQALVTITVGVPNGEDLAKAVGATFSGKDSGGCIVASLDHNGLFAQAGVAVGDSIVHICGEECTNASLVVELLQEVSSVGSGSFEIEIIRGDAGRRV